MSAGRVVKCCATCGSQNVCADAFAAWNVEAQRWEVAAIMDEGHCCEDCGEACDIETRPAGD